VISAHPWRTIALLPFVGVLVRDGVHVVSFRSFAALLEVLQCDALLLAGDRKNASQDFEGAEVVVRVELEPRVEGVFLLVSERQANRAVLGRDDEREVASTQESFVDGLVLDVLENVLKDGTVANIQIDFARCRNGIHHVLNKGQADHFLSEK